MNNLRAGYCAWAGSGDVLCAATGSAADAWNIVLDEVVNAGGGEIGVTQDRLQRRVDEIGTSFRLAGEGEERQWPLSPVPLLIEEAEWAGIAAAVAQRAELAEMIIADIYGEQTLVTGGMLPAAALTGSPHYLRPMVGITPPGGHYLHVYAVDLGRGPDGACRRRLRRQLSEGGAPAGALIRPRPTRARSGSSARRSYPRSVGHVCSVDSRHSRWHCWCRRRGAECAPLHIINTLRAKELMYSINHLDPLSP